MRVVSYIFGIVGQRKVNLYQAVCLYSLDGFPPHQWPEIALRLLEEGEHTESLAILAGISPREYDFFEVKHYLDKVIDEFGITVPTEEVAFREIVKYYTLEYLDNRIESREYGRLVVKLYGTLKGKYQNAKYYGDYFGIEHVVGVFYSYDDIGVFTGWFGKKRRQKLIEELNQKMRRAAEELIG
jgi:hypothetical protein